MNDIKDLEALLTAQVPVLIIGSQEERKVIQMLERFATPH